MTGDSENKYFLPKLLFLLLMVFGISIYVSTLVLAMQRDATFFEAATDIGRYSFTVILVGFGLLGFLLYRAKENESRAED